LFVHASIEQEARMNVRYRVELSQTERRELMGFLSGGKQFGASHRRANLFFAAGDSPKDREFVVRRH
jgi:hypothetical protein